MILLLLFEIGKWDEKDGRFESFTKRVRNLQGTNFLVKEGLLLLHAHLIGLEIVMFFSFLNSMFLWVNVV